MNVRVFQLLAASLLLLTDGCTSIPADRVVEVSTTRIEAESPTSEGLPAPIAVHLFRDVANRLGFVVDGPHQDPRTPTLIGYGAHAPGKKPVRRVLLTLMMHGKRISFLSSLYGTKEQFAAAQRAAELFQDALDERNTKYTVATRARFLAP